MKKHFSFELFGFYKHDSDCWGINLLTIGLMGKSLFGFNTDEDGWYVDILWFIEFKVKNIN